MIPFKTQYDKIVGAYMRNKLEPSLSCACFVGNLLNHTYAWAYGRKLIPKKGEALSTPSPERDGYKKALTSIFKESENTYSFEEICRLESNFLSIYRISDPEHSLFLAMESTLLMLREIHEAKGEVIEPYTFTKRVLI